MPTNRRRRQRDLVEMEGLSEAAYTFYGYGPFFEGEDYERETTEVDRRAIWRRHREEIIQRWRRENPQYTDQRTWGETLEELEREGEHESP